MEFYIPHLSISINLSSTYLQVLWKVKLISRLQQTTMDSFKIISKKYVNYIIILNLTLSLYIKCSKFSPKTKLLSKLRAKKVFNYFSMRISIILSETNSLKTFKIILNKVLSLNSLGGLFIVLII